MKARDMKAPSAAPARNSGFFRTGAGLEDGRGRFFGPAPAIQLKLAMGAPGDRFEQEADAAADRVVQRMESGGIGQAAPPALQAQCAGCREEEKLQRQAKADSAGTAVPPSVQKALEGHSSGGEALNPALRGDMEKAFAADFSGVRVHTGASAAELNRNLNARAFTYGQDVFFNSGEFSPETRPGRHLLAHELTHVVQQQGGIQRRIQRAEYATYISKQGSPDFLVGAEGFFKNWGYPNIKKVDNTGEIVSDLAKAKGHIDKFRIVSHANPMSLELGLLKDFSPQGFGKDEATFTTAQAFNTFVAGQRIMDDATFSGWLGILLKDAKASALLADMGVTAAPAMDSAIGIVLRAMLESIFLDLSVLDTGGAAAFKNRGLLDTYINQRISRYTGPATKGMDAKALAAFNKAKGSLPAAGTAALKAAKKTATFSQADADTFGDDFKNPSGKGLRPEITAAIREGSGTGSYLSNLGKARSHVDSSTHLEIRGCNAGDDPALLDAFRGYFGAAGQEPMVTAPDLYEYFFQLPFQTFTRNPVDIKAKQDLWANNPDFGMQYNLSHRIRNRDLIVVVDSDDTTLDLIIKRYGLSLTAGEIRQLNPELQPPDRLRSGQQLWLKARRIAVDSSTPTLSDFCSKHLGGTEKLGDIRKFNPAITDPDKLTVGQTIELVPPTLSAKTGYVSAELSQADYEKNIDGGEVHMFMETPSQPRVIMDDAKRNTAFAAWLAAQNYGFNKESAADLEKKLKKGGIDYFKSRFINFLSKSYPTIEDPVLPDDPRYSGHIKKRP